MIGRARVMIRGSINIESITCQCIPIKFSSMIGSKARCIGSKNCLVAWYWSSFYLTKVGSILQSKYF